MKFNKYSLTCIALVLIILVLIFNYRESYISPGWKKTINGYDIKKLKWKIQKIQEAIEREKQAKKRYKRGSFNRTRIQARIERKEKKIKYIEAIIKSRGVATEMMAENTTATAVKTSRKGPSPQKMQRVGSQMCYIARRYC